MSRLPFDDDGPKVPKVPDPRTVETASRTKPLEPPGTPGTPGTVRTVLTVGELNATIRDLLENGLQTVWVEGELSNARVWNTGHLYFTLKTALRRLSRDVRSAVRYLISSPRTGSRSWRAARSGLRPEGEYQIICEHLEPKGSVRCSRRSNSSRKKPRRRLFDQEKASSPGAAPPDCIVTSLDGAASRHRARAAAAVSQAPLCSPHPVR